MMKKTYKSEIKFKCYCDFCQGEYMAGPGEACPVCKKSKEKQNKKGGKKND